MVNLLGLPAGKNVGYPPSLWRCSDRVRVSPNNQLFCSEKRKDDCVRVTTEAKVTETSEKRFVLGFSCQPRTTSLCPEQSSGSPPPSICCQPALRRPSKPLQQLMLADRPPSPVSFWLPSQFAEKHGDHVAAIQALPPLFVLNRRSDGEVAHRRSAVGWQLSMSLHNPLFFFKAPRKSARHNSGLRSHKHGL